MAAQTSNSKTLDGKHHEDFDNFRMTSIEDSAGTKVIGTQGAVVADASGGSTVDTEGRAAINALLARLRAHGLIDT